jgi:hypothetical protein
MKVIIRVETVVDWGESAVELCHFERPTSELEPEKVGLALAEGKDVLHKLRQIVVAEQCKEICALRRVRVQCGRLLCLKDYRMRKVDTVFGTFALLCVRGGAVPGYKRE